MEMVEDEIPKKQELREIPYSTSYGLGRCAWMFEWLRWRGWAILEGRRCMIDGRFMDCNGIMLDFGHGGVENVMPKCFLWMVCLCLGVADLA